jgi:hypothetical protein
MRSETTPIYCDAAGTLACRSEGEYLDEYGAVINTTTAREFDFTDVMLTVPWETIERVMSDNNYLTLLMTSSGQFTSGEYMVALHLGIGDSLSPGGART